MNRDKFFDEIKNSITEHYGDEASVSMHNVRKNNDVVYTGVCVTKKNSNCGPTVYLDNYYDSYNDGKEISKIVEEIIGIVEEHVPSNNVDMSFYSEYASVVDKVCFKLIGRSENENLLLETPHRDYEDLAIVYFVPLKVMGVEGSILVKNEHLKLWNAKEDDLYNAALVNTPKLFPVTTRNIFEIVGNMPGMDIYDKEDELPEIYVASNTSGHFGASCILYPGFLSDMRDKLSSGFYILPSSIHEVIIVPYSKTTHDVDSLINMVRCVNTQCLNTEDILSESVYYYDFSGENNVKKVEHDKEAMVL